MTGTLFIFQRPSKHVFASIATVVDEWRWSLRCILSNLPCPVTAAPRTQVRVRRFRALHERLRPQDLFLLWQPKYLSVRCLYAFACPPFRCIRQRKSFADAVLAARPTLTDQAAHPRVPRPGEPVMELRVNTDGPSPRAGQRLLFARNHPGGAKTSAGFSERSRPAGNCRTDTAWSGVLRRRRSAASV